jgi:hypothetical protein
MQEVGATGSGIRVLEAETNAPRGGSHYLLSTPHRHPAEMRNSAWRRIVNASCDPTPPHTHTPTSPTLTQASVCMTIGFSPPRSRPTYFITFPGSSSNFVPSTFLLFRLFCDSLLDTCKTHSEIKFPLPASFAY